MKNKNGSKKSPSPNKSKIGAGNKQALTKNTGNSLNPPNHGNQSSTALIQEPPAQINKAQEQALINKKKKSTSQAEASDAKQSETENTQRQEPGEIIKKIYWVKKNLIDPTASLSYSIGVSIVHLAMAVTLIFVDQPSIMRYRGLDKVEMDKLMTAEKPPDEFTACQIEVEALNDLMLMFIITHITCFIACFYREVYSAKTDLFGQFMRIIEVFCIPIYMAAILMSLEQLSLILIRDHTSNPNERVAGNGITGEALYKSAKNEIADILWRKCPKDDYSKISGTSTEWIVIEMLVFGFFIVTMLLLLIKSRYRKIGIDNSGQFEPLYMKYLVDNVTKSVKADIYARGQVNKHDNPEDFYIDKERMVTVEGVSLKVCFTAEDFQTLISNQEIDVNDTTNWIKRNVVGKISKQELDTERMVETNSLDMMQNSGIIYHTESILEMQVAAIITCFLLNRRWGDNFGYMNLKKDDGLTLQSSGDSLGLGLNYVDHTHLIVYILFGEHIMSYFFGMFRSWELKTKGTPNNYGIETAPCEKILRGVEICVDLVIFVFVIFHLSDMTPEQRNNIPFLHLWIIIDNIIMFFTLPYTILTQVVMVAGEITKNVFTLYQVQRRKLRKRRNEIKDQAALKKNFFSEDVTTAATDSEKKKAQKPVMKIKGQEVDQPAKPKKKKVVALSYADEINNENRKNENEDVTSDSSEESSSDTDEDVKLKREAKLEVVVKEEDFAENEQLVFSNDVYNYTICANMTKCCSPLQQGFALKQCFIVFAVQFLVPLFFLTEFGFNDFTQPELTSTAVRLICGQLLHMIIYGEIKQALSVLRYLKYVKTAKGGKRGRLINIILCFLQMVSPYFTEATLVIAISQTPRSSMIIKSFVALGFVIKIDDMFSENFPKEIKATAEDTVLIIGKDQNTYSKIFKRMKKDYISNKNGIQWVRAFQNVVINILYMLLNNLYIILYYYFFPICIPFFQFFMFYIQNVEVPKK